MEYSIKLRVHGVPSEGQQIWGADIAESYVENFYGRKSSVLAQLIVETCIMYWMRHLISL